MILNFLEIKNSGVKIFMSFNKKKKKKKEGEGERTISV